MSTIGIGFSFLLLTFAGRCTGKDTTPNFTNTLVYSPRPAIAAIPGENLTIECVSMVMEQTFKVLELSGSTFEPVRDVKFKDEVYLSINKTIYVPKTADEEVHVNCSLKLQNYADVTVAETSIHVDASWFDNFTMTLEELYRINETSTINVTCSLPPLVPRPEVTVQYPHRDIVVRSEYWRRFINTAMYKQQLNMSREDNGLSVSCCVDIENAGTGCIDSSLNMSFPPADMKLEEIPNTDGHVVVQCQAGESNPPSSIDWTIDGYDSTLGEERNELGPNRGLIVSQTISFSLPEICSCLQVWCRVTNNEFPDVNITRSLMINLTPERSSMIVVITAVISVSVIIVMELIATGIYMFFKLTSTRNQHAASEKPMEKRLYQDLETEKGTADVYNALELPEYMSID